MIGTKGFGVSGEVRTYAHVAGPLTPTSFTRAMKDGHAYVTYGPLIFPDHMFGDQVRLAAGQSFTLGFDLKAVNGLKSATLIGGDAVVKTLDLANAGRDTRVEFPLTAGGPGWYALMVEDAAGERAYTDPIWVSVVAYPGTGSGPR